MKAILIVLGFVGAIGISACGHRSESSSTTYEVNGMSPEDYFRQFLYRESGQCGTIHEVHRFAKTETVKIGIAANGRDLLATISILMNANGAYRALYQEVVVYKYLDGGYSGNVFAERELSGRWSIYQDRLFLSSIGSATALRYNDRPAMQLRVDADLFSAGLRGRTLLVRLVDASYNPVSTINPCRKK